MAFLDAMRTYNKVDQNKKHLQEDHGKIHLVYQDYYGQCLTYLLTYHHIHTHMDTHTHTHKQTNKHTETHTHTHTHSHTHTRTHRHTDGYARCGKRI